MDKDFETGVNAGAGMVRRLKSLGADVSTGNFLDFGCGWGRLAYGLLKNDFKGQYVGIDIVVRRLAWLKNNLTPSFPNFRFIQSVSKNERYRAHGEDKKLVVKKVVGDTKFDTVFMGSIFTHMWTDDIEHYLKSISDVLSDNGTFIFTWFSVDQFSRDYLSGKDSKYSMKFKHSEGCYYSSEEQPLLAVGYDRDFMDKMIADAGLVPVSIHYGVWSGRPGNGFQDWYVVRRRNTGK